MSKVSALSCKNYDYSNVYDCIKKSFLNLGGIEKFISKGETVLLKVNMLMRKHPDSAVTTHPVFVRALAAILAEHGANVIIGDSPGGPFNEKLLKKQYRVCGFEKAAKESGAKLNFDTGTVVIKNKKGLVLKRMEITSMLENAHKVISVAKLKTHGMMTYTGAVKNMFGVIPGVYKTEYHMKMPDPNVFADALIDVCLYANPILSFIDGIVAMEGNGPSNGVPREMGVVLASDSPYDVDVVATQIINFKPSIVPTVKRSLKRGLAKPFNKINLVGDDIEWFMVRNFKLPSHQKVFPAGNIYRNLIKQRPRFDYKKCIGCGHCAESCPPKIIRMINGKPRLNSKKCISCFCCQELCPHDAIYIHTPKIHKVIFDTLEKKGSKFYDALISFRNRKG